MDSTPFEALLGLANTHARATRLLEARIAGHHGLSFSELRLLRAIAAAPEGRRRPSELAGELEITASGIARAILPLEKRGIVKREPDPQDARASRVTLTAAGRSLIDEASATAAQTAAKLMRRLSVGQIKQLERLLSEIG
jgi:DNA-binding MarR family transcriptional regulator